MLALFVSPALLAKPLESAEPEASSAEVADPGAEAIEIGRGALDAYARAAWETAYARFAEANRLVHSPVFVLYMARCRRNAGGLLEARELFRLVAREQLPADAPPPWSQAVATAHAELGTLQQNIPSVWVRKRPASNIQRASIEGRTIELSEQGAELELDPGEHVIEIWHSDGHHSRLPIQFAEGRRRVLVWIPGATPKAAPKPAPAPAAATIPTSKIVAYSALGLGAAGLVTSAITGLIAQQRTDDLKRDHCDATGDCYPSSRSEADAASRFATVSTVSFILGSSALVAGAGVLLFAPSAGPKRASLVLQGAF